MKPHAEMIEGPEAWDHFRKAMKTIVSVPKSALPPSPFRKTTNKKKPVTPRASDRMHSRRSGRTSGRSLFMPKSDFKHLKAESNKTLLAFLKIEVDLGLTFARVLRTRHRQY